MYRCISRALAASLALLAVSLSLGFLVPGAVYLPWTAHRGAVTALQHDGVTYYLYVPTSAQEGLPVTLMVALRGQTDQAEAFAESLAPDAERNGWALVVPALPYSDWRQPALIRSDDQRHIPWLRTLLEALPDETGLNLRDKALLYGFSRGAQGAHRFALAHPERVLAVAAMSAGTYTVPASTGIAFGERGLLEYPIGMGDLSRVCGHDFDREGVKQVAYWVGVGEKDNVAADVPRFWDRYLGTTRVERARAFAGELSGLGARVELAVVPNLGHWETPESRARAMAFLKGIEDEALASSQAEEGEDEAAEDGS